MEVLDKMGVSKMLGVSIRQVDNLRTEKGLPWMQVGSLVRFSREAVEAWLAQQTQTKTQERQQDAGTGSNDDQKAEA